MSNSTDKKSGSKRHHASGTIVRVLIIILMCLTFAAIAMAGISLGKVFVLDKQYNELENKYNDLHNRFDKIITDPVDFTSKSPQQKYYASCKITTVVT